MRVSLPKTGHAAPLLVAVCLFASFASTWDIAWAETPAKAETSAKRAPRRSTPARASQTAPDVTGTIAKAQSPVRPNGPSQASAVPDEAAPPPFYLPTVSRPRMHACGDMWHAKKMAGTTADDDWRDFAIKCLAAKDPSAPRDR